MYDFCLVYFGIDLSHSLLRKLAQSEYRGDLWFLIKGDYMRRMTMMMVDAVDDGDDDGDVDDDDDDGDGDGADDDDDDGGC